jgi:hypothetical protein
MRHSRALSKSGTCGERQARHGGYPAERKRVEFRRDLAPVPYFVTLRGMLSIATAIPAVSFADRFTSRTAYGAPLQGSIFSLSREVAELGPAHR